MFRSISDPIITIEQSGYQPTRLSQTIRASNFVLSLAMLLGFAIVNYYHHARMLQASTKLSLTLLTHYFGLEPWAWFFTTPVYGLAMGLPFVFLFVLRRKPDALALFFISLMAKGLLETLKLLPTDGRPCFESMEVANKGGCSCSFGMPSGHSSNTLVFYLLLYPLFFRDFRPSLITKRLFIGTMAFIALNVGLSRIWYGAHSFNQVIMGFLVGWAIFSGHLFLRRKVKIHLIETLAWRKHLPQAHRIVFWIVFLVGLAINVCALGLWDHRRHHFEMGGKDHPLVPEWCWQKCLGKGVYLSDRHLESMASMNAAMFMALGFALGWGRLTISSDDYYKDSWRSPLFAARRLVAIACVMSPIVASWIAGMFWEGLDLWLIVTGLSAVFVLIFFWGAHRVFHVMGVELPGDFFSPLAVRSFGQYEMPEVVLMRDVSTSLESSTLINTGVGLVIT